MLFGGGGVKPNLVDKNFMDTQTFLIKLAIGPAPHRVSRALRARNPRRVRKESGKSTPGQGPKSAQRVRPGVSKESEKSLKSDFQTLFGLFRDSGAHSLGTFGALPRGTLSGLFSDSSGVPGPKGPGSTLCGAGPIARLNNRR